MASIKTILDDVGTGLKKFFVGIVEPAVAEADKVAQEAEPFVDTVFPGIAPLYNLTVAAVASAEASAIVAGNQTGSGAQKLAAVITSIQSAYDAYADSTGIPSTPAGITAWVNGVVATLNAIPAKA